MKPLPGSLPPIIKGVTIHLFDLYALMECMGGYKSVNLKDDFEDLRIYSIRADLMEWITNNAIWTIWNHFPLTIKRNDHSIPTGGRWRRRHRRFDGYHWSWKHGWFIAAKRSRRSKCYICERTGHFDSKCTMEDEIPTDEASTSRQQGEEDTQSISSDGFHVIVLKPAEMEAKQDQSNNKPYIITWRLLED
ncbi:hypothetical protein Tco_1086669 [Tanacetum coccineum]